MKKLSFVLIAVALLAGCQQKQNNEPTSLDDAPEYIMDMGSVILSDRARYSHNYYVIVSDEHYDYAFRYDKDDGNYGFHCRYNTYSVWWPATLPLLIILGIISSIVTLAYADGWRKKMKDRASVAAKAEWEAKESFLKRAEKSIEA